MTLVFPYQEEPLIGPPPPSLPATSHARWRPLVPIAIIAPNGNRFRFLSALLDAGSDDTILPLGVAAAIGIVLESPTGHAMKWRGQRYPLRFGQIELELVDASGNALRWPAMVAFSPARIRYPLLGICGVWEYLNITLRGPSRMIEIEADDSFPGVVR